MIAFGIGSLWFGIKGDQVHVGESHLEQIKRSLEAIPNLTDVAINFPGLLSWGLAEIGETDEDLRPIYPGVEIRFGVYLPTKIQHQLMPVLTSLTMEEHFDVTIRYGYRGSIAFVCYDDPERVSNPSHGIVVVRKYLEQQFESNANGVTFETLGPSPYHCDFWLGGGEQEQADVFLVKNEPSRQGYGECEMLYSPKHFESQKAAWDGVMDHVQESAEIYYGAVVARNTVMHKTSDVFTHLEDLLALQRRKGWFSGVVRFLKSPRANKDLLISLLEAETARLSGIKYLDEALRSGEPRDGLPFFQAAREQFQTGSRELPVGQISETVRLFEGRNLSNLGSVAVLVAGLFGGAIGALVASLLT